MVRAANFLTTPLESTKWLTNIGIGKLLASAAPSPQVQSHVHETLDRLQRLTLVLRTLNTNTIQPTIKHAVPGTPYPHQVFRPTAKRVVSPLEFPWLPVVVDRWAHLSDGELLEIMERLMKHMSDKAGGTLLGNPRSELRAGRRSRLSWRLTPLLAAQTSSSCKRGRSEPFRRRLPPPPLTFCPPPAQHIRPHHPHPQIPQRRVFPSPPRRRKTSLTYAQPASCSDAYASPRAESEATLSFPRLATAPTAPAPAPDCGSSTCAHPHAPTRLEWAAHASSWSEWLGNRSIQFAK